jgi:hypothetical protein
VFIVSSGFWVSGYIIWVAGYQLPGKAVAGNRAPVSEFGKAKAGFAFTPWLKAVFHSPRNIVTVYHSVRSRNLATGNW